MYHTILVPLDGSKRAEAILPHAEELAHHDNAQVIFLRVVEPIPAVTAVDGATSVFVKRVMDQQANEAKSYLAG